MSKYIDLADEIHKAGGVPLSCSVVETLRWLDDHPDQVHGRTTTESELGRAADNLLMSEAAGEFSSGVRRLALELGITVTPDPTNAEKLAALAKLWLVDDTGYNDFTDFLDANGVKAGN